MLLRSWRLAGHKWRERMSRGGSLKEKPAALQSGSALTESQGYLFVYIPLLSLKSLCADHSVIGTVGAGSRSPPRHEGSRGELAVGLVSPAHAPLGEGWHKAGLWGRSERGHRCPAKLQGFCSCCCHSATPRAH